MKRLSVPLSEIQRRKLVEAICYGNDADYQDFRNNKRTITSNGDPYCRIDYVLDKVNRAFNSDEFIVRVMKPMRTRWEHIQIYEKQTNTLYIIRSNTNLREARLRAMDKQSIPHFMEGYALSNEQLESYDWENYSDQLSMHFTSLGIDQVSPIKGERYMQAKAHLSRLIGNWKVDMCVMVIFSVRANKVNAVHAYVPRSDLSHDFLLEEDWSMFIPTSYDTVNHETTGTNQASEDIPLSLKNPALRKQDHRTELKQREDEQQEKEPE
ncbi:DUF5986 family protein [Aneurinibacillus sp. UBA3580]|jgi:hypothetical protein|uniref:DUF5986 family protein n=1 Tax=Aneurinibacillus sp. UBA3580 TaxID=1946041 RepID=UPI002579AEAB|nr:DUF5986 family protein [Aneurinibacillus sp. UBA3580]